MHWSNMKLSLHIVLLLLFAGFPCSCRRNHSGKEGYIWGTNTAGEKALVQHGVHESRHPGGGLKTKVQFDHGQIVGEALSWHENGQLSTRTKFENGLAHGEAAWWGRDGRLLATTTNVHGTGTAYQFDDQDRLLATLEFKNGQFVSKTVHEPGARHE